MQEIICIVSSVEPAERDGKEYRKLTDMDGNIYGIGAWLLPKWNLLQPGVAIKLIMAVQKETQHEYVKDFEKCSDIMEAKKMTQPRPKTTIDISIEAQVAVKCAIDLIANGVECPDDIKELAFQWIRNSIKAAV